MFYLLTVRNVSVMSTRRINPFVADPVKALHFAILVSLTFLHSGALALRTERQSARMSEIKKGGLDQYGAEPFEQQQFGTAGVAVSYTHLTLPTILRV